MTLPGDAKAVTVVVRESGYDVCRSFKSLSAAMAGVAALGAINERGYIAPEARPLPPAVEALMERQIEEPDGLKAGEAREHDQAAYAAAVASLGPEGS